MHFFPLQKNECVYTLLVNPCKYKLKKIKNIETVLVVVLLLCVMLRYSYSYTRGSVSLTNLPTAWLLMHLMCFLGLCIIKKMKKKKSSLWVRLCALLLHSSRLINARKAWLTYNSGKPICGQFSEHCSKLSALKKKGHSGVQSSLFININVS